MTKSFTIIWNNIANGEFPADDLRYCDLRVDSERISITKTKYTISVKDGYEDFDYETIFNIGMLVQSAKRR